MQRGRLYAYTDHEKKICSMRMHQNLPFFMKKRPKMAFFWSKIEFFGFRQEVEDPPPLLRVLDAKQQVIEAQSSRKRNPQHAYARKFANCHEKTAENGRFSVKN